MRPILIAAVLMILYVTASAQDTDNEPRLSYWAIKWRATEITNPLNPSLQFGIEKRMGRNALELQLGYTLHQYYQPERVVGIDKKYSEGASARIEARRYLGESADGNVSYFIGAQAFYTYYTILHDRPTYGSTMFRGTFMMPVRTYGAAVLSGVQRRIAKHFLIEVYMGIGIKRKVLNATESYVGHYPVPPIQLGHPSQSDPYSYTTLAVPLNLALGYYF